MQYSLPHAHWRIPLSASNIFLTALILLHRSLHHLSVFSIPLTCHQLHLVHSISPGWYTIEGGEITITYISQRLLRSPAFPQACFFSLTSHNTVFKPHVKRTMNRTRYRVLFLASCDCSFFKPEGKDRNQGGFILGVADSGLPAM